MNGTPASSFWQRHLDLGLALLIVASTLALFWPAAGYDFILLDDTLYVSDNPGVAGGLTWESVRWAFTTVHENWWLPLLWLSYMADISLFGPGPHGHHVTNVLLHAVNAGLLFWILRRLTGASWRSFFVAALFAWHPLRVESVAWIAARKDVLSGLFFLLALGAYARHAERPSAFRMGATALLMGAGLMAKAILVVLPPILLLLDWWPLRRAGDPWGKGAWTAWRPLLAEKLPLFGIALAFSLLNLRTHHLDVAGGDLAWPVRLCLIAPNYGAYLGKLFWPANLSILYPERDVVNAGLVWVSVCGLAAITVALVGARRRAPYAIVGWLWFLVALFPVIRGVRLGLAEYANRFAYLPAMGLGVAFVWGAAAWAGPVRSRRFVAGAVGLGLLLALAARTAQEVPVFRDSGTALERALKTAPIHPVALLNYGVWKYTQGDLSEAERYLWKAWNLPAANQTRDRSVCAGNLGYLLVLQGRTREAQEVLRSQVGGPRVDWTVPAAWGMALLHEGRSTEAIPHLEESLQRRPGDPRLLAELLRAYFEAGQTDAARRLAENQRRQTGKSYSSYDALFPHYVTQWRMGGRVYAWRYFEWLAQTEWGRSVQLMNNVAWLAATDGQTPPDIAARAALFAERAVELTGGTVAPVLDTLAVARAAAGDFAGAIETGERALALSKDPAEAVGIRARLELYRAGKPFRE